MTSFARYWLPLAALVFAAPLGAQEPRVLPPVHVPAHPADRRELDHVEALKVYSLGAIAERDNRLIEAVHSYEEAARLDPDAAAPLRALAPLYLALDRGDDALAACRRVLELDPDDLDTAAFYARQLRTADKSKEAAAVLTAAAARPALKERPGLRLQIGLDLGGLREALGDVNGAEAALRDAAAVLDHPDGLLEQGALSREDVDAQAADVHEHLGQLGLKAGRTEQAVADFQQAQKIDPARAARLSYHLAEVYAGQGQAAEALRRLTDYLHSQPPGVDGYELRITLQRQLGQDAEVIPSLERAAGRDNNNAALQMVLAREYRKARRNADAERIYVGLVKEAPSPEIYRRLFGLYKDDAGGGVGRVLDVLDAEVGAAADKGDKPGDLSAASRARAILQVLRDDGDLVKKLLFEAKGRLGARPGLAIQSRLLLAELAGRTDGLPVAEELYRSVLDVVTPAMEQEVYFGLLRVLMLEHKYEDVITVATQGLKNENTHLAPLYEDLSLAQMDLGHTAEALDAADEVVKRAADAAGKLRYRLFRAEMRSRADKHAEAEAECLALLKEYNTAGDVREIRMVLSMAYSAAKEHTKGEEQLLLVLKADPDDAAANNDLGYQWADRNKNLAEAERMIRKALELDHKQRTTGDALVLDGDQDNASYVDSLGWVLFREGKLADARKELERAVKLEGGADSPEVWDHLGDVYFRSQMPAKAAEAWRQAVVLYDTTRRRPDDRLPEIKEKLKLLKP